MKKMLFVLNPKAGQQKANRYLSQILPIFIRAGYDVTVHITAFSGDATQTAQRLAPEMDAVVCCGGDGTFNETMTGVLRAGADVPLGYIPAGSTNDFAAGLHIPTNVLAAARAVVEGKPDKIDVGLFGEKYFAYVASFGAFTRASYATPQGLKNVLGHAAYVLGGIQELSQLHTQHLKLELDGGQVIEDDFLFGAICNSTSLGGILTLDPKQVDMADGKFELLLIRAPRDVAELAECVVALQSQKYNCRMITFVSASQVKITADGQMAWALDGEQGHSDETVEIRNLHHAVSLIRKG